MKTLTLPSGETFSGPDSWSTTALYIAGTKYARRNLDKVKEASVEQIVDRISSAIYPENPASRAYLSDMMLDQRFSFNSPVWFNVGIQREPRVSACYIVEVDDDMGSITEWWKTSAFIFKYGSGMGADLSKIRETGAYITGGGTASGPLSFARAADTIAAVTKSGSVARRSASMLTLLDCHPDVEEFVAAKSKAENIIRTLGDAGYNVSSLNSDVYDVISHQQANRAVRLTDSFMRAVNNGSMWDLVSPYSRDVKKSIPAGSLLRQIAQSVWECGDPGVQFTTTINDWHTIPSVGPINSSNPCSEYLHIDNSSCNLASINLLKYLDPISGVFDLGKLATDVTVIIGAMDRLISISSSPTEEIDFNTKTYRPLGLGISNLGGLLMSMGIAYDSVTGRNIGQAIMAIITGFGYDASARLAKSRKGGIPYCTFNSNLKYETYNVVRKHIRAIRNIGKRATIGEYEGKYLKDVRLIDSIAESLLDIMDRNAPFNNSQISVIAPTGTISFVMDCATTGVEPAFSAIYEKELAQDSTRLVVPLPPVVTGLKRLGYSDSDIAQINFALPRRGSLAGLIRDKDLPVFATAVDPGGNSVSVDGHINMMAALQPLISGAISKTVNLPSSATVEDVEQALINAHQLGIKAITFYRDGSKGAQPIRTVGGETKNDSQCEGTLGECDWVQTGVCQTCRKCGASGPCG